MRGLIELCYLNIGEICFATKLDSNADVICFRVCVDAGFSGGG